MAVEKVHFETKTIPERAILVGIDRISSSWPLGESLDELGRLAETAGAVVVGRLSQKMDAPNPRTYIGAGKAAELGQAVRALSADLVVFDEELSPSQQADLEKLLGSGVKVIDRTALILDIFALHATSREGRLQVKLAQYQYLLPRLRGMWGHLASHRMGGGVGSRFGEGESQLEVDRRLVRRRIAHIRVELEKIKKSRKTQRKGRCGSDVFRIALAGYTNAGKSSLLNMLVDEHVLAYDKLFATLDSTTRRLELPCGLAATLTDTVGFIQKLPHKLVEAFRSTLDEICEADLILLVVDSSSTRRFEQERAVSEVLGQIDAAEIPTLVVFNKIDLLGDTMGERLVGLNPEAVFVSAKTGEGKDTLLAAIEGFVLASTKKLEVLIPFDQGRLAALAHERCAVISEESSAEGISMVLHAPESLQVQFEAYQWTESP